MEALFVVAGLCLVFEYPLLIIPFMMRWPWWTYAIVILWCNSEKKEKRRRRDRDEQDPAEDDT